MTINKKLAPRICEECGLEFGPPEYKMPRHLWEERRFCSRACSSRHRKSPPGYVKEIEPVEGRVCTNCGEWRDKSWFRVSVTHKNGLFSLCRTCESSRRLIRHHKNPELRRWRTVRHRYGIDKDDYFRMLEDQNGACAICGGTEPRTRNGIGERYSFHIDHDHDTGQIRGLLCGKCNNGLGLLSSPELLHKAADYLERNQMKLSNSEVLSSL